VLRLCLEVRSRFFCVGFRVLLFVFVHLSLDALACDSYLSFCLELVWTSCSETIFFFLSFHRCRRTSYRRSFHRRSGETRRLEEGRVDLSTINSSSLHSVPGIAHILHFDRGRVAVAALSFVFMFNLDFFCPSCVVCMTGPERWHLKEGTASSWIYVASLPGHIRLSAH
jgi:hypothetical protein